MKTSHRDALREMLAAGELTPEQLRDVALAACETVLDAITHVTIIEVELKRIAKMRILPRRLSKRIDAAADRLRGLSAVFMRGLRGLPRDKVSTLIRESTREVIVQMEGIRLAAEKAEKDAG